MVISEFTLKEILQVIWANIFYINTNKSKVLKIIIGILILLMFNFSFYYYSQIITLNNFSQIMLVLFYTLLPLPTALIIIGSIWCHILKRKQIIFFKKPSIENLSKIDNAILINSNIRVPYIKYAQQSYINLQTFDVGSIYKNIIILKKNSLVPLIANKRTLNLFYIKKKDLTPEQLSILKSHVKLWIG